MAFSPRHGYTLVVIVRSTLSHGYNGLVVEHHMLTLEDVDLTHLSSPVWTLCEWVNGVKFDDDPRMDRLL